MNRPRTIAAAVVAAFAPLALAAAAPAHAAGHDPKTPIKHFVFLLQENHTFDNYFGTRAGVDGIPPNVCMPVKPPAPKPCIRPFHIGAQGSTDLDHNLDAFDRQYDHGKMDGFVASDAQGQGKLAMGYYDRRDLPYYWRVADNYVLFDHFFSSATAGSPVNHLFSVAARGGIGPNVSDAVPANGWGNRIPTIFDRLQAAGVSWKFYVQNYDPRITYRTRAQAGPDRSSQVIWVPLLAMNRFIDNPQLASHIVDASQYYQDVANGTLPSVSFIVPAGDSEHPPGRVQSGETFVRALVTELQRSRYWPSSAFLWSYDDWGGFYDHVKPPQVDSEGYGFRVPALLVSPYARRGYVDHTTFDFTSVLKFIEQNWSVPPLASRDARATSIANAFNFSMKPRPAVLLDRTAVPPSAPKVHRAPVLAIYLASIGLMTVLVAVLLLTDRRSRRRRAAASDGQPPSRQLVSADR
ncbi:MAG TPA: alkaline phosphatase family protein [Mycobacteriales bacterium]|nr:alkaline phosphatase family protein [Mycobacteriales bacterium]